jgi:hypothetical protein
MFLQHFYHGLSKEATLFPDISLGGSFSHRFVSEGKSILDKILENTPYIGVYDEIPEEVKLDLEPKEEAHATELELPIDPSHNLVAEKCPDEGTQNQLEDEETSPLELSFEFEEDLFEDYENTLNLPIQPRPLTHTTPSDPHKESVHMEHIKSLSSSLSSVMSYEWLIEVELSPEVARITSLSTILLCQIRGSTIKIHYNPSVGINFISKALTYNLYPDPSLTPSQKFLQRPSGSILESYRVLRTILVRINYSEICLDFYIYDILEIPLLIGKPIMRLLKEKPLRGHLDFKVGNSTINIPLACSVNTIVEPKSEQDSIEEVLMASLEEMAQPALDDEHFVQEEEELAKPIELDKNEQPSPPSIELKPLPLHLRYVFLHNNRKTQ